MTILLTVLKWIGIILLIILALVLVLILLVLFVLPGLLAALDRFVVKKKP